MGAVVGIGNVKSAALIINWAVTHGIGRPLAMR